MRDQAEPATTLRPGPAGAVAALVPGSQLLFRVPEAMRMLALSKSAMYRHLSSGRIRSTGRGRDRRISAAAILGYIELREQEEAGKLADQKKEEAGGALSRPRSRRGRAA